MRRSNRYSGHRSRVAGALLGLATMGPTAAVHAENARTVEIVAQEFGFQPATIEMEAGETVRLELVNQGQLSHNLHLRGVAAKTGTVQTGNSDTLLVTAPDDGTIGFYCAVPGHEQAGMTGEIVVE